MAVTVAECDAIDAVAERGGASLMVAHCWRFHDDVYLRCAIASPRANSARS